jgi:hypothetical protein
MRATFQFTLFVLAGAFFIMADSFFNGFPIVYSDTSTYLAAGFELQTPIDRPMAYGIFLRIFSFNGLSLWFVILFQALIVSYLIFLLARQLFDEFIYLKFGLVIIILLSILSSISWTASQLMPDIFTSTALLSAFLIIAGKHSKSTEILLFILYFISVIMHMSHLILFALILTMAFFTGKYFLPDMNRKQFNRNIAILFVLTLLSIPTMGSSLSKSRHVFLMGSMAEKGILKKYLADKCNSVDYKICDYKEVLPQTLDDFVWKENSPLYKLGGWKATKPEFNKIIYGTMTEPRYISMHVRESVKATYRQLLSFKIGDGNGSFPEGTVLHGRILKFSPNDRKAYESSIQYRDVSGHLYYVNIIFSVIVVLSILISALFLMIYKNYLSKPVLFMVVLISAAILLNAWDCATFSTVADRFGSKLIWLAPLTGLMMMVMVVQKKLGKKKIKISPEINNPVR